jgi:hypothetical protein
MIKTSTIAACLVALSASGAVAQSMTSMNPNPSATYIVDEYGRHYNERGDQIYARGNVPTSSDRSWRSSAIPSGRAQAVMAPRTQAVMGPKMRLDIA